MPRGKIWRLIVSRQLARNYWGWCLCRTKLPRKALSSKTKFKGKVITKSLKNGPKRPRKLLSPFSSLKVFHRHFFTVLRPQFRTQFQGRFRTSLRAQRLKNFKIALRDWNFQSRLKISSEPPSKPLFSVGNSEGQDWNFQSRLKISSEIEIFNRDWFSSIFGPLGFFFTTRICRHGHARS